MKLDTAIISLLSITLLSITIYFIVDSEKALTNCVNNVPPENCNKPAGDFAIETDTTSVDVLKGCGPKKDRKCIFSNIDSVSNAIRKCNSLGDKCNRFIYENNTMTLVSLVGKPVNMRGKHLFVRQNGITFETTGSGQNAYPKNRTSEEVAESSTTGLISSSPVSFFTSVYNSFSGPGSGY